MPQPQPAAPPRNKAARRHSEVKTLLAQVAMDTRQMQGRGSPRRLSTAGGGPEFDRLRSSLQHLKLDMGGVTDSDTRRIAEHFNTQVVAIQRAFELMSEALEDETSTLRTGQLPARTLRVRTGRRECDSLIFQQW